MLVYAVYVWSWCVDMSIKKIMRATKYIYLLIYTSHFAVVTLSLHLEKRVKAFSGPRVILLPWTQQRLRADTTESAAATSTAAIVKSRANRLPLQMSPTFNFEAPTNRSDTGSIKLDKYRGKDVIPMWVRIG